VPHAGLFVRARLQELAALAEVTVVAPVPIIEYSRLAVNLPFTSIPPAHGQEGRCSVWRPRWLYPPFGGLINSLCLFLRILPLASKLRRSFPFDVIDSHFGFPEGIAAGLLSRWFGVPFTITLRGNETAHSASGFRRMGLRWAVQRASRVITVSERLAEFATSLGADPAKVRVISNGVDTRVFYPRNSDVFRRKYSLSGKLILSVGHLIEAKGHHRIVRAVKALHADGIPAKLLIAGGPGPAKSYRKEILAEIEALGLLPHVHLLGERRPEEVADLIAAADVFCLASSSEGCPNVVNEALACGAPVVATDVGAIPQMIPSERYGIVVRPDDDAALVDGLRRALTRDWDRDRIAEWGQRRSWFDVSTELLEEFNAIAGVALHDVGARRRD